MIRSLAIEAAIPAITLLYPPVLLVLRFVRLSNIMIMISAPYQYIRIYRVLPRLIYVWMSPDGAVVISRYFYINFVLDQQLGETLAM